MRRKATLSTLLGGLLILAGCRDEKLPVAPIQDDGLHAAVGKPASLRGLGRPEERNHVQIAEKVPAYGGHFYDPSGNLVVYVTDLRFAAAAKAAVRPFVTGKRFGHVSSQAAPADILVREGQYTFTQLQAWREPLNQSVLWLPGIVYTDLNEGQNRLAVAVQDQATAQAVEEALTKLPMPREAVIVFLRPRDSEAAQACEVGDTSCETSYDGPSDSNVAPGDADYPGSGDLNAAPLSIQDRRRPVVGGLKLRVRVPGGAKEAACTVGFNGRLSTDRMTLSLNPAATGILVMVTTSHCRQRGVPDAYFYQPEYVSTAWGNYMAYESWDPLYRSQDYWDDLGMYEMCVTDPTGRKVTYCRWSDASISEYAPANTGGAVGAIARTYLSQRGQGGIYFEPGKSDIRITGSYDNTTEGEQLDILGHNSGWRIGTRVATCVDSPSRGGYMEFCQSIVDYASFGGDSGAPVFKYYPETNTALLLGIHTGRYDIKGGATVSSLANIEYDFGFSIVF